MITVSATDDNANELAWRVHDLLSEHQALRTTTSDIVVEAAEGKLTLNGRVRTNVLWDLAYNVARNVAGDWELEVNLISDEALTLTLARKIGMESRLNDANVRCEVFLGVVHLKGTVSNPEQPTIAEELAAHEPGVVRVEDHLTVLN